MILNTIGAQVLHTEIDLSFRSTVVVPDRDHAGKKLVEDAIGRGWGVSLPDWDQKINDVGDCVDKYGRLYTLYSIASAAETSPLKIRLRAKKWFT